MGFGCSFVGGSSGGVSECRSCIEAAASFSQVSFETMPDHIQTRSFEEERSTGGIDYLFIGISSGGVSECRCV